MGKMRSKRTSVGSSPYRRFCAAEWGRLGADVPLSLTEAELQELRGQGETITLDEVEQIYLPLSQLLNLYAAATFELHGATNVFLGDEKKVPFIIGVAGSVAVGKSTTSRLLQYLLSRWSITPKVDLLTTDGFLYPNKTLQARDIMHRKGFPESFDLASLRKFLAQIKSGQTKISAPVYSHIAYDIVPDEEIVINQPDILIVEGLNVLQPARISHNLDKSDSQSSEIPFVSDFFDFSIYIDADADVIKQWYIDRFMSLRATAFRLPGAYFQRYAEFDDAHARATAEDIWTRINLANLEKNILPTRGRADLILHKTTNHGIDQVLLRKI